MREISYTILSDGSSDQLLIPIINWTLKTNIPGILLREQWADLRRLPEPPRELFEKIEKTLSLYETDIFFIHRDAENQGMEKRIKEINAALAQCISKNIPLPLAVFVIPIRMTEAWLLIDDDAIRRASGNVNTRIKIELPKLKKIESISDPKDVLHNLLRKASGKKGRRLEKFNRDINKAKKLVAENISDFSPLRQLSAFKSFEDQIIAKKGQIEN